MLDQKSRIHNVIMDKNCSIEAGCVIGENIEEDKQRFPFCDTIWNRCFTPKEHLYQNPDPSNLHKILDFAQK